MEPVVRDGETVELRAQPYYLPGDVVGLGLPDGRVALHRVIGYRPTRSGAWAIVTRADSSSAADAPADPKLVIGRLVAPAPGVMRRARSCGHFVVHALRTLRRMAER